METELLSLLGGIGLFLFGMHTMTGSLRDIAGPGTRAALTRFTRTPLSGALTGTATTALIQSSSATTVTAVGLVGAGLISFPQAVGVIFGANVGTTITGWMVMGLGLKLKLGIAVLPVLFLGSLLRMFGSGRRAAIGVGLVGFGLIFLGLDMMQRGLAGASDWLTPESFPPDTLAGRAALVVIGAAITAVTQSSSAGVAAALIMLAAGAISFAQAAALVIGMDVGTSVTAVMASLGGSRAMRQTALAHVAYNLLTGAAAFAMLGPVAPLIHTRLAGGDGELALVSFHSLYNLFGAMIMLPFARPFADAIARLLPEIRSPLTEMLDPRLLADVHAALDAAQASAAAIMRRLAAGLGAALAPYGRIEPLAEAAGACAPALAELRLFAARIPVHEGQQAALGRYSAFLHQLDHLQRLQQRCGQGARMPPLLQQPQLRRPACLLGAVMRDHAQSRRPLPAAQLARLADRIAFRTTRLRQRVLARRPDIGLSPRTSDDGDDTQRIFAITDAIRWLERSVAHLRAIAEYSAQAAAAPAARPANDIAPPPVGQ